MPTFTLAQLIAATPEAVFARLADARFWPRLFPPELDFRVLEGPEQLAAGARLRVQMRRWGLNVRVLSEVTAFEPSRLLTLTQIESPFRRWVHTHEIEPAPSGTRLIDRIDYEPPRGVLGLTLTSAWIERDLAWVLGLRPRLAEPSESL